MTRAAPRMNSSGSGLIRLLTELDVAASEAPQVNFAERLGQYFDFSDAVLLSAVHADVEHHENAAIALDAESDSENAVREEFLRVRRTLINFIVKNCTPGATNNKLPSMAADAPIEMGCAYEPYHRFYLAQQREIAVNVRQLRANVRNSVSVASPALKQLVALDAVFDEILWERTRKLFSTVPKRLEKRFEHLLNSHRQTSSTTNKQDNPAQWVQSDGWLGCFCRDMQSLLLAEIDVHLQPVLGLLEAFSKEVRKNQ